MLTFEDALRVARGCTDYSGGYRYDKELYEAYQDGIGTVIGALEKLKQNGLSDSQTRVLHRIGGEQDVSLEERVKALEDALRPFAQLFHGDLSCVGGGTVVSQSMPLHFIKEAKAVLGEDR